MDEIEYYNKAKNYLLSFDSVSEDMLEAHINGWRLRKPKTIKGLFKAFLLHAQNRQGRSSLFQKYGANNHMHSDSKKRRSFLALLFSAGDVWRSARI